MAGIVRTTETLRVEIASGSAAAERTFTKQLRTDFDECVGVIMYTTSNGGDANFRVELVDENAQPIFEMVHNKELEGSSSVPVNDRYKDVLFRSKDRKVTLRVSTTAALTSDFKADFVFKVQRVN